MSLIHDALRKAAEENEKRAGQSQRPTSWRDVEPPPARRRSVWPWVLAGGLVLGASGSWWFLVPEKKEALVERGTAGTAGTSGTSGTSPAPAAPEAPAAPVKVAEEKSLVLPPPSPAEEKAAPASKVPAPAVPDVPDVLDVPDVPKVPDVPANPSPTAPPKLITPPAQQGQVAADTFVLEAEADGVRLRLDFIVWSDAPFAQINGRQVGVGQQVDGFLVVAISRESVQLESPTRRLTLRVR